MPHYALTGLSAKQMQTVCEALDLYQRIMMGQFEELTSMARMGDIPHQTEDDLSARIPAIEQAEKHLQEAKALITGHPPNSSFGIFHDKVRVSAKIARELQAVIRHRLAWDRQPEGGIGVAFDDPYLLRATTEPKVAAERIVSSEEARVAELPEGCMLTRQGTDWLVLRLLPDRTMRVIAQAPDLQTSLQMAKNVTEGRRARGFML